MKLQYKKTAGGKNVAKCKKKRERMKSIKTYMLV